MLQTVFGKLITKAGITVTSGETQNKISRSQNARFCLRFLGFISDSCKMNSQMTVLNS